VRRAVVRGVRLLVLPTVVVLGVAVFASGRLGPGVRIYALIVCAVVLALDLLPRTSSPTRNSTAHWEF